MILTEEMYVTYLELNIYVLLVKYVDTNTCNAIYSYSTDITLSLKQFVISQHLC